MARYSALRNVSFWRHILCCDNVSVVCPLYRYASLIVKGDNPSPPIECHCKSPFSTSFYGIRLLKQLELMSPLLKMFTRVSDIYPSWSSCLYLKESNVKQFLFQAIPPFPLRFPPLPSNVFKQMFQKLSVYLPPNPLLITRTCTSILSLVNRSLDELIFTF